MNRTPRAPSPELPSSDEPAPRLRLTTPKAWRDVILYDKETGQRKGWLRYMAGQTTHFTYAGQKGSCDQEIVLVGARIRPCQGLGNTTTSVIVNSKVLDPWCTDFFAYYPVTKVTGAAQQGNATRQLVQTDTTPGTPAFDTGFDVANGPIIVTITELSVNTAGGLECGWFG